MILKKYMTFLVAFNMIMPNITVAAEDSEYINVVDFGAKGDGISDDQKAFDAALEAAKKSNKPLYVPAGLYLHSDVIKLDGTTMFGDGYDLSVLKATTYRRESVYMTGDGPGLYNMYMIGTDGARNAYESSCCIQVQDSKNAVAANNRTYRGTSAATSSIRSDGTKFLHNYMSYSRADGNINFLSSVNIEVANNLLWNTGDDGIAFTTYTKDGLDSMTKNIDCHDNAVFSNPGSRGITINGAENADIYRNYIESGVCSVCVGADLSWASTQNKNIRVYENILKNCGASVANSGGAVTIRNDRGSDGATDTSRNIQAYNNTIYNPVNAAFVTYGEYPVVGSFYDNKVYIDDGVSTYKHQSDVNNMRIDLKDNMRYPVSDYPGDFFEINAGPDYSIDWGLPETDSNMALKAKAQNGDIETDKITDGKTGAGHAFCSEKESDSIVVDFGEKKSFNTIVLEDVKRSLSYCDVEYFDGEKWVFLENIPCGEKFVSAELDKNITSDKIRISLKGKSGISLDEVRVYNSRKLRDITGSGKVKISSERMSAGNGSSFLVFAENAEYWEGAELSAYLYKKYEMPVEGGRGHTPDFEISDIIPVTDGVGSLRVRIPENVDPGQYTLLLSLSDGENLIAQSELQLTVASKFSVVVLPEFLEDGKWNTNIRVTNLTDSKVADSRLVISDGGKYFKSGTVFNLSEIASYETKVFSLVPENVNIAAAEGERPEYDNISIKAEAGGETILEAEKRLSFLAAMSCEKEAPVVDGIISDGEWDRAIPFYMNDISQIYLIENWSTEDLSGVGRILWDSENLYFSLEVTDDIHSQNFTGDGIWNGDSIQLAFDSAHYSSGEYNEPGSEGYTEIGVALASDGSTTGAVYQKQDAMKEGAFKKGKQSVLRSGNITTYEISMPWSELLPDNKLPAGGNTYGFSLVVNDADAELREGFIAYFDGIGIHKRPEEYGELILVGDAGEIFEKSDLRVNYNGCDLELGLPDEQPEGALYIPLREFSEQLGAKVIYNSQNRHVTVLFDGITAEFSDNKYLMNQEEYEYIFKPFISDEGKTFVSAGTLCNAFGLYAYFENNCLYLTN